MFVHVWPSPNTKMSFPNTSKNKFPNKYHVYVLLIWLLNKSRRMRQNHFSEITTSILGAYSIKVSECKSICHAGIFPRPSNRHGNTWRVVANSMEATRGGRARIPWGQLGGLKEFQCDKSTFCSYEPLYRTCMFCNKLMKLQIASMVWDVCHRHPIALLWNIMSSLWHDYVNAHMNILACGYPDS